MDLLATLAMTFVMSTTPADLEPGGPFCRANGRWYRQGEMACIELPCSDPHLARCDRVLNNPSWLKLQDECPLTFEPEPDPRGPDATLDAA